MQSQRGFSLLEVILVLVMAGLLMGVAVSALSEGPVLRKSAREVSTSLRHARSVAILRQQPVVWSMNIDTKQFWVAHTEDRRSLHQAIEASIHTARSEVVSEAQANIRFFPDGSSTGGSVELRLRDDSYKVNVEWVSGRISIL